ncbi:uncharacterized protein LOC141651859 [Silene latifolia]|uniref:uncharacterized protein LOC141651859 n=1 Tax=Silene latifolia TaxID=37657 RepID=UPI003D7890E5
MRVKVPYYDPVKSECVMRYQKMQEEFEKLAIKAMNSAGDFDTVLTGITTISQNLTTQNDIANEGRMSSEQVSQNEDRRGIIFFMDNSDGSQTKVALQDPNQVKAVGRPRITVRQKQTGVSRKKKSQRTNLQNKTSQENIPKKRKNRNTGTAQDEMALDEDDLFLRPSASVANCGPTTHLSDDIHHPGEYTRMLQYFEQRGQSNNLVNEKLSRSNMEQQS